MTSGLADIWTPRRFLPYRRVSLQIELNPHIPSCKERHVYIQPVLDEIKMTSVEKEVGDNLRDNFTMLTNQYFNVCNVDWSRYDFYASPIFELRECVQEVRKISLEFSRMDNHDLNRDTVQLIHAIEFEIRRRPFDEQYPEIWGPLKAANETLRRITTVQEEQKNRQTEIAGWQRHFDGHLENVFTDVALKYLREKTPYNIYRNIFGDNEISKSWKDPNFELDGLIYDETPNIFYMIGAKFYLTESQLAKTEATLSKLCQFLQINKPHPSDRKSARRLNLFFGESGIVKQDPDNAAKPTVSVFLGVHSSCSEHLITEAKSKDYMVIRPDGTYYKVF